MQNLTMTVEEYWRLELSTCLRYEFWRGQVREVPGGGWLYAQICGNLAMTVVAQLSRDWHFANSVQRLWIEENGFQTHCNLIVYPAQSPIQNPLGVLDDEMILHPHAIFEVLSDGSRDYDQNEKFARLCASTTLRHYVLIDDQTVSIEHRFRDSNGAWQTREFSGLRDEFRLESLELHFSLAQIYEELDLPEALQLLEQPVETSD